MDYKRIKLILLIVFLSAQVLAQGCSDAGFCTMGAMKPDQAYSKKINFKLRSIELSQYKGNTHTSASIAVTNLDISVGLTNKTGFQIKIPYQSTSGSMGKAAGLGDISLSVTHNLHRFKNFELNGTLGMKIPSNKSDIVSQGRKQALSVGLVLPMYYQISLGSWDVIAGASLINENWLIAVGYQNALTANNNTFKREDWTPPAYPSETYSQNYDEATKLKRGSDVMLRVERNFRFARYNFNIGLLSIYRISKDQIIIEDDITKVEAYEKLEDTTGAALTGLFGFGYNLNINNSLKFTYGYKLTDREVNPDGLTRDSVIIFAYLFRF